MFRFVTDSSQLIFKWKPYFSNIQMNHMPATGVSGIDVYAWNEKKKMWVYKKTGMVYKYKTGGVLKVPWKKGQMCLVNLPLYNGIKSFEVGIDEDAGIYKAPARASGVEKPVVFYGTSITHGGCASRPGLSFVNIIGRSLDIPVVGLGFSGSGKMEYELSGVIARINASLYVIDTPWNMSPDPRNKECGIPCNYEPFVRNLRAKRPGVPILLAGMCDVFAGEIDHERADAVKKKDDLVRGIYNKLLAEGMKDIYYLPSEGMLGYDFEGTVDGVHPNDIGMLRLSECYGKKVAEILKLKK
jgi:hypothetical protein